MTGAPKRIAALAGLLLLGGCAGVATDAGFSDVQNLAAERLGASAARWERGAPREKVPETIGRILEAPLTVDGAVQIAFLNSPRLQVDFEDLGIAQADLIAAGLLENPTFSAEILVGGAGVTSTFSLVQNFFNLLTRPARSTIASSAFERAKYELGHKVLDLAAEVRAAYYSVVAAEQAAELSRQVVSATEAAAELSQRQVEAGNATARDQSLQQAQYAQAVLMLARAEVEIAHERERLNRLLGLWGDQVTWNLPDRLSDLPAEKPSLEGLETLAIERRLDLAGARADVQTANYALDLGQQLRWLSVLGLGVKLEREPDGKWLKGPVIEISLPIFDQGQGRIASLEAQRRRSEKMLVSLAVDARSQVREAWTRLSAAQDAAAFYRTTVLPLQQRILEENTRLYNGMLIGVYDLLRSRQEQIDAGRAYIAALKDYWIARADLEKALAGPLPGAGASSSQQPK